MVQNTWFRAQDLGGVAEAAGLFSLEKWSFKETLIPLYIYVKGGCNQVEVSLLSQGTSDRTREEGLSMC